jgi:capsular exopolysaccharide synthesis family protein
MVLDNHQTPERKPTVPQPSGNPTGVSEPMRFTPLQDFLVQLRERLMFTLPLSLLITLLVGYYQASVPPMFSSSTTLQVERPEKVVVSAEVVDSTLSSEVELNTYLQVFSSKIMRSLVLDSLTADERARLTAPRAPGAVNEGTPDLGSVSVVAVPRTFFIRLTVTHRDPAAAALLANRYATQFIAYNLGQVGRANTQAVEFLQKRVEELREQSNAAERRLQDYMRQHDLVSLDSSTNLVATRLGLVTNVLQNARLERIAVQEQFNQVAKYREAGGNLLELAVISKHGSVSDYARRLEDLRRERLLLNETYLAKHPRMIALATALSSAEEQLQDSIKLAIADLEATLAKARENEHKLEAEFALQEQELFRLRDLSVEFKALENAAAVAKSSHAAILSRLDDATTVRPLAKAPVRLIDHAEPDPRPVSPDLKEIALKCTYLGLFLLAIFTILLSRFDDRLRSTFNIEDDLNEKLLGIVPAIEMNEDSERFRLLLNKSDSLLVEPFMNLHATLTLLPGPKTGRTLLVTSTVPGEGKTMVASNLAAAFALHGRRTLLIDCDLRRPMLHHHLGLPNQTGILSWLQGSTPPTDAICDESLLGIHRVAENFYLLPSGGRTPQPTPLFEGPRFAELIQALRPHFDQIILDTPPLGAVSDVLYIAKTVDEAAYICRFGIPNRRHVRLNLSLLRNSKCQIHGLILNSIRRERLSYYSDYHHSRAYERYYGARK